MVEFPTVRPNYEDGVTHFLQLVLFFFSFFFVLQILVVLCTVLKLFITTDTKSDEEDSINLVEAAFEANCRKGTY